MFLHIILGIFWLIVSSIMIRTMYILHWENFKKCDRSPFFIIAFCLSVLAIIVIVPPILAIPYWIAGLIDTIRFFNLELTPDNNVGSEAWMNRLWRSIAALPGKLLYEPH